MNTPMILPTTYSNIKFSSVGVAEIKESESLSPGKLSSIWGVGLKTAKRTLLATTYECICTTGLLAKRFEIDKTQLH